MKLCKSKLMDTSVLTEKKYVENAEKYPLAHLFLVSKNSKGMYALYSRASLRVFCGVESFSGMEKVLRHIVELCKGKDNIKRFLKGCPAHDRYPNMEGWIHDHCTHELDEDIEFYLNQCLENWKPKIIIKPKLRKSKCML